MKKVFKFIAGIILAMGAAAGGYFYKKKETVQELSEKDARINKFVGYFNIMDRWLALKEKNIPIDSLLLKRNYKNVAIYGLGVMGKHLYEELKDSKAQVAYAIDKKADKIFTDLKVITADEELPSVDAIIVTATFDFQAIQEKLAKFFSGPIISLEEIIYDDIQ